MKHTAARSIRVALFAAFPVFAMTPSAQALEMATNFYVVASLGQSDIVNSTIQRDNDAIVWANLNRLKNTTISNISSGRDKSEHGAKLQLGYQFDPNFAVEGGYVDLGKTNYLATYKLTPLLGTAAWASSSREIRLSGWNISGVGILPIDERFSLFGKLGLIRTQVKTSDNGAAGFTSVAGYTQHKWRPTYGVGGKYAVSQSFAVRAELDRYDGLGDSSTTGKADVNLWSLGLEGRF